jgi:hypothetical protein
VKGRTQTMTFTCEGKNTNIDFYLKGRTQTITFTCEGKNTNKLFLPVKGRTQTNFYLQREEHKQ